MPGRSIGTTHIKAVLVDSSGSLLGAAKAAKAATPVTSDGHGVCHDPEWIRLTAEDVMRCAQRAASGHPPVAAIGVSSVGEEGVPLGPDGEVLYPAIAWHERRTSASASVSSWRRRHEDTELFAVTGLHPHLWFTVYKWLWLKDSRPEAWRSCRIWHGLADYVMWRWTGQHGMSYGHASRTGILDLAALAWHEQWAAEVLPHGAAALPPLLPAGSPVGELPAGAIDGLSVRGRVPVVVTGHDHVVGGYAAGVTYPGQLLDSMGTAEALVEPVPAGTGFRRHYGTGIDFGTGILPGTQVAIVGLESGAGISGMARALSGADLDDLAAQVGPGAEGLRYLPPLARPGAFVGHKIDHGAPQFYRAVIEGWSLAADNALAALGTPDRFADIVCIGGGSASDLRIRIKASIAGRPVRCVTTPEMVAVGAALLAGGIEPATAAARVVSPVAEWVPVYQRLRDEYRRLTACATPADVCLRGGRG